MPLHGPVLASIESLGGEMFIIAIVALLLFGKDAPVMARKAGVIVADLKRKLSAATSEITREMNAAAQSAEEAAQTAKVNLRVPDTAVARKTALAAQLKGPPPNWPDGTGPKVAPMPAPGIHEPNARASAPADSTTQSFGVEDNQPPPDYQV